MSLEYIQRTGPAIALAGAVSDDVVFADAVARRRKIAAVSLGHTRSLRAGNPVLSGRRCDFSRSRS